VSAGCSVAHMKGARRRALWKKEAEPKRVRDALEKAFRRSNASLGVFAKTVVATKRVTCPEVSHALLGSVAVRTAKSPVLAIHGPPAA
jgi:hypothetical protein